MAPRCGRLRTVSPGREVLALRGRQRVDLHAHRRELEPGNLEIDLAGHSVHPLRQAPAVCDHMLGSQGLVGKLMSITAAGCPSAAARLMSRPSPRTKSRRPFWSVYSSTNGRTRRWLFAIPPSVARSSSTLKWPALARIAPSFRRPK